MRYVVKDSSGKWQASYSKSIPAYSPKEILSWAKQTARHCGGAVYEVIVPNSPQYPTKEHKLFDYSFSNYNKSKGDNKKNKKVSSNKKNTDKDNKKDK